MSSTLVDLARERAQSHPHRGYRSLTDTGAIDQVLSYADLDRDARRIAVALADRGVRPSARALLVYPTGLEFVRAFWGCLFAGVVAVPVPPPHPTRRHRTLPRLRGIARDSGAEVVLTSRAQAWSELVSQVPGLADATTVITDELDADPGAWRAPAIRASDLAMLQYTSGSTRDPRGVMLSHANMLHNLGMLREFHGNQEHLVIVHWLPLYHDMGLIRGTLSPLHMAGDCYMMSPMAFLQRPSRWLAAATAHRATTIGSPNFGYELCVRRIADEDIERFDLSSIEIAFCSAEPIKKPTVDRFIGRFARCGFQPGAFRPAYGLAEATVMVAGQPPGGYRSWRVSQRAMRDGRIEIVDIGADDGCDLMSCGLPMGGQELVVVDSDGVRAPADRVGEIWIRGPSVGGGYHGRPDDTRRVFDAFLSDGTGPFLRTGDLGWIGPDGGVCVLGRQTDLIIVRGQNYHPHDIETTIEAAAPALRPGCTAVFAVDRGGVSDAIVVACEVDVDRATGWPQLIQAIRRAVSEHHELTVEAIAFVAVGQIPKTASGKVQRSRARQLYLGAAFSPIHTWSIPDRGA